MEQSKHGQGITSVKYSGQQPGGNQTFNIFGAEEPKPKPAAAAVVAPFAQQE